MISGILIHKAVTCDITNSWELRTSWLTIVEAVARFGDLQAESENFIYKAKQIITCMYERHHWTKLKILNLSEFSSFVAIKSSYLQKEFVFQSDISLSEFEYKFSHSHCLICIWKKKSSSHKFYSVKLWLPTIWKPQGLFLVFFSLWMPGLNSSALKLDHLWCVRWLHQSSCHVSTALQQMLVLKFPGSTSSKRRWMLVQPSPVWAWSFLLFI